MILVGVLGVSLGSWREIRRREEAYRARLYTFEREYILTRIELQDLVHPRSDGGCVLVLDVGLDVLLTEPEAERLRRRALHYRQLVRKYEAAVRFPWLPVEPDPPNP